MTRKLFFLASAVLIAAQTGFAQSLRLNDIDVDKSSATATKATLEKVADTAGKVVVLVQFSGPIQPQWREALEKRGATLHHYIPEYAYFVTLGTGDLERCRRSPGVIWVGLQPDESKVAKRLRAKVSTAKDDAARAKLIHVNVLSVDERAAAEVEQLGHQIGESVLTQMGWYQTDAHLPLSAVAAASRINTVFHIEEIVEPKLHGEREAQTAAGRYEEGDTTPAGPGYVEWLASEGLSGAPGVIVQVQDSGLDQGIATNAVGTAHADILGRIVGIFNATSDAGGFDKTGHGTIDASIIMGNAIVGTMDPAGFLLGQGVAPQASVYATKIFNTPEDFSIGGNTITSLATDAQNAGATFSNNSWGSDVSGAYDARAAEMDALVRDADPVEPGNQQMVYFVSAGNVGPAAMTVASPASGKNVLSIGAAENSDADGIDGSNNGPAESDNIRDLIDFSSRGPAADGRLGVTVVSVGTHVQGAASTVAGYTGASVSEKYWPVYQTDYARSSGTSHSGPLACGAGMIVHELFDTQLASLGHTDNPSPALIKAVLVATATDLAGGADGAGGTLTHIPNTNQGWGAVNLTNLTSMKNALYSLDQTHLFTASAQLFEVTLTPVVLHEPFKVTLAWTDQPAAPAASPTLVNDLDLEVVDGGTTFLGNVFVNGMSTSGGSADRLNTLEAVFIDPAGGPIVVRVKAYNIAGDGVPGAKAIDQDFALFAWNAGEQSATGTIIAYPDAVNCADSLTVSVSDSDLQGDGTVNVSVTTSAGDSEPLTLNETAAASGIFTNAIITTTGGVAADGQLQVVDNGSVIATYSDAHIEGGGVDTVDDTAAVDCTPPAISNVHVEQISSYKAYITFETNEDADGLVRFGSACGSLTMSRGGGADVMTHAATLSGLTAETTYYFRVEAADDAGNTATDTNGGACYSFATTEVPDYFTERFSDTDNDVDNETLLFTPEISVNKYSLCRTPAATFPTDYTSGTSQRFLTDAFVEIPFTDGKVFPFFGVNYSSYFLSPNGNITFGQGETSGSESFTRHFQLPRIAAMFDDFAPSSTSNPLWYQQFADRAVVTWPHVPEYGTGNSNNFQVEMFFDGRIQITHLAIAATDGLVGLSAGQGRPGDFIESDISAYGDCSGATYTISGKVTVSGGGALSGVTLGGLPGNPTTNGFGQYDATVDGGFSGTVTPQLANYSFSPVNRMYANVASDQSAQDYVATLLQPVLSVTPSNRNAPSAAGSTDFGVSNTGTGSMSWEASVISGSDWLSITSGSSGTDSGTINVSYEANDTATQRAATVRVIATGVAGSPKDVTVTQDGAPSLGVTPNNRDVSAPAGSTTFDVAHAGGETLNWSASVISGDDWLGITSGSNGENAGAIDAAFEENTTGSQRVGTIRVTATGALNSPKDVTVTQAAAGSQAIVTVTKPNGGEKLVRGKKTTITWTTEGDVGPTVAIDLIKNGQVQLNIKAAAQNSGSVKWKVPKSRKGKGYRLRITSSTNAAITDQSDGTFKFVKE